jgi:hypothetical protein
MKRFRLLPLWLCLLLSAFRLLAFHSALLKRAAKLLHGFHFSVACRNIEERGVQLGA